MMAQNLGMKNDTVLSYARFEKPHTIVWMLCFEKKNLERLMDYTVTSLKNPHTIRGRPTLKDVKCFRNGSSHKFCHLKVLITLKEVNTSDVEKRKNLHEQNFDDEIRNNKQIVINLTLLFKSLILFLFFMMLDTSNEQFDISYITSLDCVSSKIHNLQHAFCPGGGGTPLL